MGDLQLLHRRAFIFQLRLCMNCGRFMWFKRVWLVECGPNTENAYCDPCWGGARKYEDSEWSWAQEQSRERPSDGEG